MAQHSPFSDNIKIINMDHLKTIDAIIEKTKDVQFMSIDESKFREQFKEEANKDGFLLNACKFVGINYVRCESVRLWKCNTNIYIKLNPSDTKETLVFKKDKIYQEGDDRGEGEAISICLFDETGNRRYLYGEQVTNNFEELIKDY